MTSCNRPCVVALKLLLGMTAIFLANSSLNGQEAIRGKGIYMPGQSLSPSLEGKTLQVLFDGVVDMYFLRDRNAGIYYISDIDGRLFTLSVPYSQKDREESEAGSWRQGVITILKQLMHDAPQLFERIEAIRPVRHELTALLHDYHTIVTGSGEGIIYEYPQPAFIPRAGFFAGYNIDFIKAGSSSGLDGFKMYPAIYPLAGISVRASLPRISRAMWVSLDLSAGKRYVYGYYKGANFPPPPSAEIYHELHQHSYLLTGNLLAGYSFGRRNLKPFVSGGICMRSLLKDDSRMETDISYEGVVISDTDDFISEEKNSMGLALATGLTYNLSRDFSITAAINYSELIIPVVYGSYRSAGLKIGVNF